MTRLRILSLAALTLSAAVTSGGPAAARISDDPPPTAATTADPCRADGIAAACTWERTFGGPREDKAYAVAGARDGGLFIAGNAKRGARPHDDGWVLRLDAPAG